LLKKAVVFLDLYLPPVCYAGLIFLLSSRNYPSVNLSHGLDKVVHLSLYSGFGYLVLRALRRTYQPRQAKLLCLMIVFLYGITDEFHQSFVPGRSFEVLDMASDGLGGVLAVVICSLADRYGWPIWL